MWTKTGTILSGHYGKWNGKDVELSFHQPEHGTYRLIHDGPDSPGEGWTRVEYPNRFARGPVHWYLKVPESEITDVSTAVATTRIGNTTAVVIAESDDKYAVEVRDGSKWAKELQEKYGMEMDDMEYLIGWVPACDAGPVITTLSKTPVMAL